VSFLWPPSASSWLLQPIIIIVPRKGCDVMMGALHARLERPGSSSVGSFNTKDTKVARGHKGGGPTCGGHRSAQVRRRAIAPAFRLLRAGALLLGRLGGGLSTTLRGRGRPFVIGELVPVLRRRTGRRSTSPPRGHVPPGQLPLLPRPPARRSVREKLVPLLARVATRGVRPRPSPKTRHPCLVSPPCAPPEGPQPIGAVRV
jgi:hypothetical protein